MLRRVLGYPARRLFDRRILWLLNALDERLGRPSDGWPVHERLDRVLGLLEEQRLDGPGGLAARAGLWFNPPVAVGHDGSGVRVRLVNERIVEQPFVFAALAERPPPARVLDAGGAESTVALSLASLGYDVTVADPRGYALAHPRLTVAAGALHELGDARFDVVVALSAIEHFGVGHYGDPEGGTRRLDLDAMADFRRWLAPEGLLVLTVPVGPAALDDLQRTYDAAGLEELLDGFTVHRRSLARALDRATWVVEDAAGWDGGAAVMMLTASPDPVA